jgi:uncharacterized protein
MDKKTVFRQLIADFIETPLRETKARDLNIPTDIPKIISLLGPRRAGKTYVLYHIARALRKTVPANRIVYINFEDDRLFPLRLADMDALLQAYYELFPSNREQTVWFMLDEVQEVPNWEKFVRRLADTENCRIYLTGSSSKLLSRELATALRGRTLPFEVFPLSFSEFLQFNGIVLNPDSAKGQAPALHWFDRWLAQGGFPELVFLPEDLHRSVINEYLDLMLYRDLTERFSVKQPALLKYLLKYFLQNLANPTSLTKVFNDLKSQGFSIAKNTVFDYVSHMEEAFVLFRTNIWRRSVRAQAINPGKYYVVDPAFKYAMSVGEDKGRVLENAVFLHLRRQGLTPHYFMEQQEVDFYWENGQPINVCLDFFTPDTREREVKGMLLALKALDQPVGIILTRDRNEDLLLDGKRIEVRAAWRYFLGLL